MKAAEKGEPAAMYNLGLAYAKGLGLERLHRKTNGLKGYTKKVKWLSKKTLYYVRIRAYHGDSYGPWSKVKTVRTK